MSDFWARHLSRRAAKNTPPPAPATPSAPINTQHRPWWDVDTGVHPAAPPQDYPPAPQQSSAARPMHVTLTGRCPACGSGNYFPPPMGSHAAHRCFDCGYPRHHSTTGAALPSSHSGSPATPARQIPSPGYQPNRIVARIKEGDA